MQISTLKLTLNMSFSITFIFVNVFDAVNYKYRHSHDVFCISFCSMTNLIDYSVIIIT